LAPHNPNEIQSLENGTLSSGSARQQYNMANALNKDRSSLGS
jgi:hypothetical protein